MAIDTTIHRDADGRVALTPEQAEALALAEATREYGPAIPLLQAIRAAGDAPPLAIARYVLATAPIVRAAVAQADAVVEWREGGLRSTAFAAWMDSTKVTEAAVRAWPEAVQL